MTKEAFITEVHSINGDGEDEGVVYSEMESVQNTCDEIMSRKLCSLLYGNSGYISSLSWIQRVLKATLHILEVIFQIYVT